MKLRTLIIDDEPIALEKLKNYVEKTPFLSLTAACQSGIEAMQHIVPGDIDLIITDINMPDLNGMDLVRNLPTPPMVIFTTAYQDYAVDSYKLSAVDYLLKPYGFPDFQRAVTKAYERTSSPVQNNLPGHTDDTLFIKTDYRYIRIDPADIRYVKGYGEYLQIHICGSDSPLVTLSSFQAILDRLPSSCLQVHRSYIVNMEHVQRIERARIIMDTDTYIPIGDRYKDDFTAYLATHSIGRAGKQ